MTTFFAFDGISSTIQYRHKTDIVKRIWHLVFPESAPPLPKKQLRVIDDGPFKVLNLSSHCDTFYKSLSLVIFGDEDSAALIKKAILLHAIKNESSLNEMFQNMKPNDCQARSLPDYLRAKFRTQEEASYVEIYVATHLFKTTIILIIEEDVSSPFLYNIDTPKTCPEYAVLLAIQPTPVGKGFYYNPIISYMRKQPSESETESSSLEIECTSSSDDGLQTDYAVTLNAHNMESSVSISFSHIKNFSTYLAEFCGQTVETNLTYVSLRKLQYFVSGQEVKIENYIDPKLYEFAKLWVITELTKRIEKELSKASTKQVTDFANHINLLRNTSLYELIEKKIYESDVKDLKYIRIMPRSDEHKELNDMLTKVICCKNGFNQISPVYTAHHVVISIDPNNVCMAKYFNGEEWQSTFLPKVTEKVIPYLKENKYCIAKQKLFFIKDNRTLGTLQLFNEFKPSVSCTPIPEGSTIVRVAATSDPNVVLLMSDEAQRMICTVQEMPDGTIKISDWIHLEPERYGLKFIGQDAIIYSIGNLKCVLQTGNTRDVLFGVSTDELIYCYNFGKSNSFQTAGQDDIITVRIPKPTSDILLLYAHNAQSGHHSHQ